MPVVPRYQDDVRRAPKSPVNASAESFGASNARALKSIADGLRSVETEADRIAREDSEARAKKADLGVADKLADWLHNPETGYLSQKGGNAVEQRQAYRDQLKKIETTALDGIEDGRTRRSALGAIQTRIRAAKVQAANHYRTQRDAYHGELGAARITQSERDIASDPMNPEAWERGLGVIEYEIEAAGRRNGLPDEAVAVTKQAAISKAIANQILMQADTDPAAATALFERSDLIDQLTPADRDVVEDTMRPVVRDATANRARELYGSDPEAMEKALGLGDAAARDPSLDALPVEARRKLVLDARKAQVDARKEILRQLEPRLRRAARDGSLAFDELRTLEAPGIGALADTPEGLALINELESDFDKATKGRAALAKFIERVQGGGRLTAYDIDDRKLADAAFEASWEAQQKTNDQAQELRALGESYGVPEPKSRFDVALDVARYGAAPDVLVAEARQGLDGDAQTRIETLEKLSGLGDAGRSILRGAKNGDKVAEAMTRYNALLKAGYEPQVAVEFAAPSVERAEIIKQSATELRAVIRKTPITEADLTDAFGAIDGPRVGVLSDPDEVGEGVELGDVGALMAEYRRLLEVEFVQAGGDIDVAKEMAGARLVEKYGATFLTSDPQVMQHPPDTTLGMGDAARGEVERQLGEWMSEHAPEGAEIVRLIPEFDDRGNVDGYSVIFDSHGEIGRVWDERFRVDGSGKRMREIEGELESERSATPKWMELYSQGMAPGERGEADAADPEGGEPDPVEPEMDDEQGAAGPSGGSTRSAYRIDKDQPSTAQAGGERAAGGRVQVREDDQGRLELEGVPLRYAIAPITYSKSRPQRAAGIVLHHTAPMPMDRLVRSMQTLQRRGGGPAAYYGYHFAIGPDGEVVQAAPLSKRTNHVRGPSARVRRGGAGSKLSNANTISISFVGAASVNAQRQATGSKPSEAQVAAARQLIAGLRQLYDIPGDAVYGHGELQKDRHGDEGAELARELRGG